MKLNFSFRSSFLDVDFHIRGKNPLATSKPHQATKPPKAKKCPTPQKQKPMQKSDISQTITIINHT